jgi:hypothetical protein
LRLEAGKRWEGKELYLSIVGDDPAVGFGCLPEPYKLIDRRSDVSCDLSQQDRQNITASMIRDCGVPSVGMPKLGSGSV